MEEKEKVVRRMWDLYTHGTNGKLPRFWQQAFEAAYEALASDVPAVRDAAVSEIAKISIRSINLDPFPDQSTPVSNSNSPNYWIDKVSMFSFTVLNIYIFFKGFSF